MEADQLIGTFESEAGFKALFDYATIGIVVINQQGVIVMINPNGEKLFGYHKAELIGQKMEVLIPTKLREQHIHHRTEYFDRPKVRPMGAGLDLYASKKDGSELPVEISLGNYQVNGETLAVAFISDITERKEAEREKKEYTEELEKKVKERTKELENAFLHEHELNQLKSAFVSLASHEFRTPLSTIMSSVDLLSRYDTEEYKEKKGKHLKRVKSSVRNLVSILDDFLSLDKLEQGKIKPELLEFPIEKLVHELVENFQPILKEGQQIKIQACDDWVICSDKKLIKNIVTNLVSNASKYSVENDPIEVSCEFEKDVIVIIVRDYGIGIPDADQLKLFGSFYRASNVGNIQGTGLGLSIVQRYVELLGGTITFESKQNEGTAFIVRLPCEKNF
ncbi:PAS domain-containing sensor histidine kinase [Reichenbachiella sp.]|uniref:PAS domain-containing sensor histidine kinase n=1 Tax=Reichenbachiella sp. TaxID=2184521 RepID=UPI003297DC92